MKLPLALLIECHKQRNLNCVHEDHNNVYDIPNDLLHGCRIKHWNLAIYHLQELLQELIPVDKLHGHTKLTAVIAIIRSRFDHLTIRLAWIVGCVEHPFFFASSFFTFSRFRCIAFVIDLLKLLRQDVLEHKGSCWIQQSSCHEFEFDFLYHDQELWHFLSYLFTFLFIRYRRMLMEKTNLGVKLFEFVSLLVRLEEMLGVLFLWIFHSTPLRYD